MRRQSSRIGRPRASAVALTSVLALVVLAADAQDPPPRRGVLGPLPEWAQTSWLVRRQVEPPWALTGAHVVDVRSGEIARDVTVVIAGDMIRSIGPGPPPAGIEAVDASGGYVIPGLVDLHAHVIPRSRRFPGAAGPDEAMHLLLDAGVTLIRELPLVSETALEWGAAVNRAAMTGPTIVPASTVFEQRPGRTTFGFGDPETAAAWVRKEALLGSRWIKIYDNMDEPSLRAIVGAAREHGLRVCGHASQVPPDRASAIGMATIEHIVGFPYACLRDDDGPAPDLDDRFSEIAWHWRHVDDGCLRELIETLRANGTGWVPTLVVSERVGQLGAHDGRPLADGVRRDLDAALEKAAVLAVEMHRLGGRVGIGTDFPIDGVAPGRSVHRELELMVTMGGATPLEALQMATIGSVAILGFDDILGTVEPDRLAHLVVLGSNPLDDVAALSSITMVVHDGRRHTPRVAPPAPPR